MPQRPRITVQTNQYGPLEMRFGLLVKDFEEVKPDLDPRELAAQIISRSLLAPTIPLEEIHHWDDDLLSLVVTSWAKQQPNWNLSEGSVSLDTFKQAYANHQTEFYNEIFTSLSEVYAPSFLGVSTELTRQLGEINHAVAQALPQLHPFAELDLSAFQSVSDQLVGASRTAAVRLAEATRTAAESVARLNQVAEMDISAFNSVSNQFTALNRAVAQSLSTELAESVFQPLYSNLGQFADSIHLAIPTNTFFENLPDFSELAKRFEPFGRALDALDQDGYSFMYHWSIADIAHFIGVDSVNSRVRKAVMTTKVLALVRKREFFEEMKGYFEQSTVLKRRWHIIEEALDSHHSRKYSTSIPTLLAQVEGVFTDALVLKGLVVRIKGKLYAKDGNGNPKLDKNGKRIQLHGLGQKVQNSDLRNEDILQGLAEFFVDYVVPERNDIMHGNHTAYDKAKLSVQLILNLYLLAAAFVDFEGK